MMIALVPGIMARGLQDMIDVLITSGLTTMMS
jgi:hypothetical protein